MKTTLRSTFCMNTGARFLLLMTFMLIVGGVMSSLMPMVNAETNANIQQANAAQPLEPLDPVDESDAPPADESEAPPAEDAETPPADGDEGGDSNDPADMPQDDPNQQQPVPATIQVNLYWCQAGTDVVNAADGAALLPSCGEQGNSVQVALVSATNSSPQQQGSASTFPGSVQFIQLAPDSWNLFFQTTDLETQGMFCYGNTSQGNTKPYARYFLAQTSTPGYQIDTLDDESIICDWFGVPAGMQSTQVGFGDLKLMKYECSTPPDPNATFQWFHANCTTTMDSVEFTLDKPDPDPDIITSTNDTGTSGYIQMLGVDAGTYPLTESTVTGFEPLAVFCATVDATAIPIETEYTPYTLTGSSIQVEIASEKLIDCQWFNIAADGISLTIYKWECPAGTLYGQTDSYYSAECATEQAGIPFDITDDGGTQSTTSDTNGRQINNLNGQIIIQETIPQDFGDPVVFCQLLNDATSTLYPSANGLVTLPATTADDYQCFWYNLPFDGTTVTIYKWECPAGTLYGQTDSYYSAECATEQAGVPFQITDDNGTQDTTSDTNGRQIDGLDGEFTITELVPPGFGNPAIFCQLLNDATSTDYSTSSPSVTLPPNSTDDYQCWFYNIPETPSTVTIYKWRCPDGMPAETTSQWFATNCATPMDGVEFNLIDSNGPKAPMITAGGQAEWTDVATGAVQITETIPSGYYPSPYLVCDITEPNTPPTTVTPVTINGTWNTTISMPGTHIVCQWYNWYMGPGEITVYKWTCPEGYDRTAWGADPTVDCTGATNGVTFKLDQPDPGVDLFSDTGDSVQGAVYFGGLEPGDYTLTEMLDPAVTMSDVFVWQCTGLNSSSVHPTPLSIGQNLTFKITGGDKIVCHWFNVPMPQYGWMEVSKFNCTTETYVKDVYCYTNQTGQEFNLQMWVNGTGWSTVQTGVTDVNGKVMFHNLDAGAYQLIEPNTKACLIKSSNITSGGFIGVNTSEATTVYVYNCKAPAPPQTGKTPGKYPNTGLAPATDGGLQLTPGMEIAGLIGLMGMHLSRRRLVAGSGLAAAILLPSAAAQQLQPITANPTPVPGTPAPEVFGCDGTPEAWTQPDGTPSANGTPTVDPCNRGAIPIHMRIPVIEVDAPMEYLEIIDGLMQQPTGDTHITWYKETSRLGEIGNGIYAAHVNWYGNPEGIFFRLESLQEGDVIEIDGDDQQTLLYDVQWARDFPSDEEPPDEALGVTDEVAITLITCGGEWSSALSEYDHRTLVRAVLRE